MVLKKLNSLGFAKPEADTRVVVAMSGGVDSSVVAAMLKAEGYDVIGVTLQLYDHGAALSKKGACCAGVDIHDARRIAEGLNFPHYVLNYENIFKEKVIDEFADSYLAGATPVPCIRCNERIKFKDLLETAKDLNADCMATGHYIRRMRGSNKAQLHCAVDHSRDQSYFLFSTTNEQLEYLRFPLGDLTSKKETRLLAKKFNLNVADKPDSQDICFVPSGDYASVIQKFRPDSFQKGNIKNLKGEVVGVHDGIINFTIGQRKGIKVSHNEPLYVVKINSDNNEIIVGPKDKLGKTEIELKDVNLLTDKEDLNQNIFVKVRSTGSLLEAKVDLKTNNGAKVNLTIPEDGISPGQACVFYSKDKFGDKLLGGGWIKE